MKIKTAFIVMVALLGALPAYAAGPLITPGLWQLTTNIAMTPNPKLPPEIMARMNKAHVSKVCITPEMAARAATHGFGTDESLAKRNCTRTGAGYANGHIDQVMMCKEPDGSMVNIHMVGTYTPTTSHLVATFSGTSKHMMMQSMTSNSVRIGECTK